MSQNARPEKKVIVQMTLTLFADGQFTVTGIPRDEFVAKGFLVKAQEAIYEKFKAQQSAPCIEVPRMTLKEN